ncbi:MAG: cation transporter [Candidatus Gracilibacteria bacterium]|nr:cation transporter [Candidatus Gracilibacteria bacterium]
MSLEKIATLVSSFTALLLVSIKMTFGILSGSIAVLSSAIDSVLDMFVSVFNYFAVKNAELPADEQFNYGRGKIEALAAFIEGLIIFLSGTYILYESFVRFFTQQTVGYLGISIMVMLISFCITLGLVYFLDYAAKKTKNLVIESDALHYKTDLLSTGGILFSLIIIYFTSWYLLDAIVGAMIALYIMYSSVELIKKGMLMILDVALDESEVTQIKDIINKNTLVNSYHYLKTRRSGKQKFVEVHLVFTPTMTLLDAHNSADEIIDCIKKIDKKSKWIVNIHLDPYDDSGENENVCKWSFGKNVR